MNLEAVANEAGVSKATVHRVLKHSEVVSPITANVVLRAMKKVGYVPRGRGRQASLSLRPGVTSINLGVLFYETRSNSPLTARLLHGIEGPIAASHSRMLLMQYDGLGELPSVIENYEVDGLIVRPGSVGDHMMNKLPKDIPAVWLFERRLGYRPQNVDCVGTDDSIVGEMMFNCLYHKGRRNFVIFNPWADRVHYSTELRIDAFNFSAKQVGSRVTLVEKEIEQVIQGGIFTGQDVPTGVYICGEVDDVLPVYNTIQRSGLAVGRDIDVVCCVQTKELMKKLDPEIILVDINSEKIAETAVETLLWRLENPHAHPRTIIMIDANYGLWIQ
jgi:DNA-binding LacI/PurR family transcriptional regulator